MSVYTEMLKKIKQEIANDPKGLGYSGKTNDQIANLMNVTYAVVVSSEVVMSPRINEILAGLEFAPNAVDKTLVNLALAYIGT